jgi:light-regulated signal transduction histidine kinase (bacteriophytochrome)
MMSAFEELGRQYAAAIESYMRGQDEAALSRAYEIGRRALVDGIGIIDLIKWHDQAMESFVLAAPAEERAHRARGASDFFRELVSPFEMTFRGYRQANEELQRVNADLARQKQAAEASNRELESFSYSVSHDLRAPLRAIDGFSRALMEDAGDALDAQGKRYLRSVRDAAKRMSQLIDDLLELSRVSRMELTYRRVDLTRIARGLLDQLRAAEPDREVEAVIEEEVFADGDARLLAPLLQNLVGNAWKFSSKRERARIEFGRIPLGGHSVYFVRDNGAGFDMRYASKLFGAFQRLHAADEFEGTGVGLATVQRIARRHGGEVWAESEVDSGATFYFTLSGGRPA